MYKSVGKTKEIFPKKIAEILHSSLLICEYFFENTRVTCLHAPNVGA
jgi:hypothetical protein